jgi:hypothetical protein
MSCGFFSPHFFLFYLQGQSDSVRLKVDGDAAGDDDEGGGTLFVTTGHQRRAARTHDRPSLSPVHLGGAGVCKNDQVNSPTFAYFCEELKTQNCPDQQSITQK